jgi:hypothetical protein
LKEVFQKLQGQIHIDEGDKKSNYHLQNGLLYKVDKLCVPKGERLQIIKEAYTSKVARHFGVGKTIANLQRYVYLPKMQVDVARYIRGYALFCTRKPSNRKKGLYYSLPIPTRPWESISMDFVGGLPTTRKGHDFLFVVVDMFRKMCILMSCKKMIKG